MKGADLGTSGGRLVLDFNFAYNPSCAYDPAWACPLRAAGIRLPVAVRAGGANADVRTARPAGTNSSTPDTRRPEVLRLIPLTLTMLIALLAALAALAVSGGHDAAAHDHIAHQATAHRASHITAPVAPKELALRLEMRRLWHEHTAWTRLAIVSLTTDAPDTKATVARLLRNQTDIGNAVKPFYGAAAGRQLDDTAAGAHRDRSRPDRGGAAGRPGGDNLGAGALERQRRPDRGLPLEHQSALLEARRDEGDDARPPAPDDRRGRCPSPGPLGRRTPDVRPRRAPDPPAMADMLSDGLVAQFPSPLPLATRDTNPYHPPRGDRNRLGATRVGSGKRLHPAGS